MLNPPGSRVNPSWRAGMLPGGRSRSGRGVAVDTDQRTCCRGVSVIDLAILFGNRGEFGTGKSSPGQQRQREDGENVLGRGNRARNCHVVMQLGFYKVEYLVKPELHHNMAIASSIATAKNILT